MRPCCRPMAPTMSRARRTILAARRTATASSWALCACLAAPSALAGDASPQPQPAATPKITRCGALGEGFFAVSGSDACIRISGYVAAGADFGGALRPASRAPGPFDAARPAAMRTRTGIGADARFDTPMGPGRVYVQFGRDAFQP